MNVFPIAGDPAFDTFEAENAERPMLITFVASWCMPCKALKPVIDDLAQLYAGAFATCRIDIEECPETARRFAVRGVPTTLLRRGGDELLKVVGPMSKTRLAMALDDALAGAAQ
jgi:thioredoxin 1